MQRLPRRRRLASWLAAVSACLSLLAPSEVRAIPDPWLVFRSNRDSTTEGYDVFCLFGDDGVPKRLTHGLTYYPAPLPGGREIAFVHNSPRAILTVGVDDLSVRELYGTGREQYPSVSADGRWLLFTRADSFGPGCPRESGAAHDWVPEGCTYLYRADLRSGGELRLTDEPARMLQARFSPDGARIAVVYRPQHGYHMEHGMLQLMDPDGGNRRTLHEGPVNRDISWSPDGRKVLYSYQGDLWTIDVATEEVVQITDTAISEYSPSFSPDGTQIAFVVAEESIFAANIWRGDAAGTWRTRVTHVLSNYSDVAWIGPGPGPPSSVDTTSWGELKDDARDSR